MFNRTASRCLLGLLTLPVLTVAQQSSACWLRDANSPAPATAYLLCEQGKFWATTDGGATWVANSTGAKSRLRAFSWIDAKRGVAIGDGGLLLATNDGGKTWQPRDSGVKQHLIDITFVGESGWISGYQGVMLHSADGGNTWQKQTTKTTMALEGVFFLDQDRGWSVGWSGAILRTTDGGKTWTQVKTPAASWTLFAVYFQDANNGWITGFAGQLLRSKDGGLTWTAQKSPVKNSLNAIAFDSANRGWIAYDDGLLVSEDKGETWTQTPAGGRFFLGKLLPVDKSLWAIGQSVVLMQSGSGREWKRNSVLAADSAAPFLPVPETKPAGR